jgi:aspartate/methionine/tyrosine aminotransferase
MSYRLNAHATAVVAPPIAEVQGWVRGRSFPASKPLIDVAQAVPSEPPAATLRAHLAARLDAADMSLYTDILGLPALREALARHVSEIYAGAVTAADIGITAGCNQAFCVATAALAGPGDEVVLTLPYYFNYQMWLEMQGIRAVHLPVGARDALPDPEEARRLLSPRTRAIVLVTPNNPTGAEYPPELIGAFHALAREHGIALILDETYRDFRGADGPAHGLFRDPDWRDTLVQLYSFSKVYSLAGYRVGAIACGQPMMESVEKIVDCVAICAPRIGQEAALFGVQHLGRWREERRQIIAEKLATLRRAFRTNDPGYELVSAGAYFAYLRHPFAGETATEVARRLADRENLLCVPGSMFGPGQESYLRFAFANLDAGLIPELAQRLASSRG